MNDSTALVVEDDISTSLAYSKMLETMGYSVHQAHSLDQANTHVEELNPSIVLLDIGLPDGSGLDLLKRYANKSESKPQFVVITGDSSQDLAVACLRARVDDFLSKPVSLKKLRGCFNQLHASRGSANEDVLEAENEFPMHELKQAVALKGNSMIAHQLRDSVRCCSNTSLNAVISGAIGVDKSSVAYAVHQHSQAQGQFVCVFGSDLSSTLSSNSIQSDQSNYLLAQLKKAQGGTLLISDICSLPLVSQASLCSYLRKRDSAASAKEGLARIKIVATINEDWEQAVIEGRLNQELYHRLAEYVIHVPGLKDRLRDIPEMANAILSGLNRSHNVVKRFAPDSFSRLQDYMWPGNIRELNNVIKQCFAGKTMTLSINRELTPLGSQLHKESSCVDSLVGKTFWETEKALLFATLDSVDGDKATAAQMLGISLKTLYNRLKAYS